MARGRPWPKGVSANPGGRPKKEWSLSEYVRQKAGGHGRQYVDRLYDIAMQSTDERVCIEAIKVLLDRGWKKPIQGFELDGNVVPLFAIPGGLVPSVSPEDKR